MINKKQDKWIIKSLLDTDIYKYSMLQFMYKHEWDKPAKYIFKNRSSKKLGGIIDPRELKSQINNVAELSYSEDEYNYLLSLGFCPDFAESLIRGDFDMSADNVIIDVVDDELVIEIEGPVQNIMMWETFILSIISELYTNACAEFDYVEQGRKNFLEKVKRLPICSIVDFGTRRRASALMQEYIIRLFQCCRQYHLKGTSNLMFAKKYNLTPVGSMAHEVMQIAQVEYPELETCQQLFLMDWLQMYPTSIVLTDTLGIDKFCQDMTPYLIDNIQGYRHDSGSIDEWLNKIDKLSDRNIKTKIMFSDGVTFDRIDQILDLVARKRGTALLEKYEAIFGIGTNLTNDIGIESPNIVIKIVEYDGKPVAKISDSPGKTMCQDEEYLKKLKKVCNYNK